MSKLVAYERRVKIEGIIDKGDVHLNATSFGVRIPFNGTKMSKIRTGKGNQRTESEVRLPTSLLTIIFLKLTHTPPISRHHFLWTAMNSVPSEFTFRVR